MGSRMTRKDVGYDIFISNGGIVIQQFAIHTNHFLRFFPILTNRKKKMARVTISGSQPKIIHKIIIKKCRENKIVSKWAIR